MKSLERKIQIMRIDMEFTMQVRWTYTDNLFTFDVLEHIEDQFNMPLIYNQLEQVRNRLRFDVKREAEKQR